MKQTPWKCRFCKRINKATASYCGQCGRHWAEAIDGNYQHVPQSQRRVQEEQSYAHWEEDDPPWSARSWGSGRWPSQSPRTRSQTPAQAPQHKNRRKNKKGKEKGKSQSQFQAPALPEAPWTSKSTQSTTAAAPSTTPAEQQLRALVTAMKKNESSLPAYLQAMLQETHKAQSQDMTKVLHSAVTKLGKAKKTLQDARASRMQLHNVWKTYLAASAEKWQEFCKDFEKQDNDLAQQVMSATDAVKTAQEGLEASKREAKEVEDLDSDSKDDMALEISDEESQEVLDSKGQALKEGLNLMLANLESLKEKAELAAEENAAKRPRKRPPDGSTQASLRSFGVPGQ